MPLLKPTFHLLLARASPAAEALGRIDKDQGKLISIDFVEICMRRQGVQKIRVKENSE